jgi:integrase
MANRVLAVLSKLMTWAEQHAYRPQRSNPCRGVEKYREQPRRRYLTPDELKRLGAAFRIAERWHAMSPTVITALRLILLTGARSSEILSLRWREVDLAGAALHLPDSKTGRKTNRNRSRALRAPRPRPSRHRGDVLPRRRAADEPTL